MLPLENTVCQIDSSFDNSICWNQIAKSFLQTILVQFSKSILLTIQFAGIKLPNRFFWQLSLPNWLFFWQSSLLKSNCQILPLDNSVCPWSFVWQFSLLESNCPIDPFDNSVCCIDSSFDNQVCLNWIAKSFLWTIQFAKLILLLIFQFAGIKLPNRSFWQLRLLHWFFFWQFNLPEPNYQILPLDNPVFVPLDNSVCQIISFDN